MPRLSRAESQARTREKLLATAKVSFLRDGFAPTSLEAIADAAGFSKGAVYSNFGNKDELCLAVIDAIRREQAESLAIAMFGKETLERRITALEAWSEDHIGDRAWTALEVEFAVHASRDAELAKESARRHRAFLDAITELVRMHVLAHDLTLPMSEEDVATTLLSLGIGLGLQRAIDPTLPVRTLGKMVRLLANLAPATVEKPRRRTPSRASPKAARAAAPKKSPAKKPRRPA